MARGDHRRKITLAEYGFRLPSCIDNRPLRFNEWDAMRPQTVAVSATPGSWEMEQSGGVFAEQVIRPTGLIDPPVEIRPVEDQVQDCIEQCRKVAAAGYRTLVTTLTKRMAEDLTEFMHEAGLRVRYMHSDVETLERIELIRDLRLGVYDVLVGINLLREGLDIPECGLVCILDADKEGFLRSETSLIQTIGRAARNVDGRVILYADRMTGSMERAIAETDRRREKQRAFNELHGITPESIKRNIHNIVADTASRDGVLVEIEDDERNNLVGHNLRAYIEELEAKMRKCFEAGAVATGCEYDIDEAEHNAPPLTTVSAETRLMGARCAESLLGLIQGSDPQGGLALCRQVTYSGITNGFCPTDMNTTNDPFNPYPMPYMDPANGLGDGGKESPVAAAVVMFNLFKKNANNGVTTPDYILRPDAVKVAFMVTDEPLADGTPSNGNGINDWWKYFGDNTVNPDNNTKWATTQASSGNQTGGYDAATRDNIINYFKSNKILTYGMLAGLGTATPRTCANPSARDLPRCTVQGNGGVAIDIEKATDPAVVAAAMDQIATDLIGASSQYKLTRSPITSTIKVNVNGVDVPRSRSNGFDYDPVSKSVVFYGLQYNPQLGQQVIISYRVWVGSIG